MKMTVKELMEKIEAINRVIDELDKMPEFDACTNALQYHRMKGESYELNLSR